VQLIQESHDPRVACSPAELRSWVHPHQQNPARYKQPARPCFSLVEKPYLFWKDRQLLVDFCSDLLWKDVTDFDVIHKTLAREVYPAANYKRIDLEPSLYDLRRVRGQQRVQKADEPAGGAAVAPAVRVQRISVLRPPPHGVDCVEAPDERNRGPLQGRWVVASPVASAQVEDASGAHGLCCSVEGLAKVGGFFGMSLQPDQEIYERRHPVHAPLRGAERIGVVAHVREARDLVLSQEGGQLVVVAGARELAGTSAPPARALIVVRRVALHLAVGTASFHVVSRVMFGLAARVRFTAIHPRWGVIVVPSILPSATVAPLLVAVRSQRRELGCSPPPIFPVAAVAPR